MTGKTVKWLGALVVAVLPLTACEDGIGVDGTGTAEVTLSQSATAQMNALANGVMSEASLANVSLSSVESIKLTITGVDLLKAEDEEAAEESEGGWVSLNVVTEGGAVVDLLAVPAEGATATGIDLARGEVEAGSYSNLRIRFSSATITFNENVQIGPALFEAGTEYELVVPSGAQTGIKTNISVLIEDGETDTINVIFDSLASTATINATGSGRVIMAPVLRSESTD